MKRLRWQILIVILTLVVVGVLLLTQQPVGPAQILPQPTSGGVYTEALVGSLGRLNPLLDWNNSADHDVDHLIFSGLFRFDAYGLPQSDLAESWGVNEEGTIYNITLKSNALWHDGMPVTSDDVIFTIGLLKSDDSLLPGDIKALWNSVEVIKLDDKNIKFTIPEPYAPFLDYLTFGVLPKHLLETVSPGDLTNIDFNINPIGSGPYKFDQLLLENGRITGVALTAAENYYGKQPFIPQIVFRYYPSSSAARDAYEQGEVLGISRVTPDILEESLTLPNLAFYTSRMPQISIVMLNLNDPEVPFLQEPKIRRALLLGLNRQRLISKLLKGQAITADGPILPGSWAYYQDMEHLQYDPEGAIALLKNEGYVLQPGGGEIREKEEQSLSFTLLHPDDDLHTRLAQAIQSYWLQIGVGVTLQPVAYDRMVFDHLGPRTYQAALVDLNLARTPDPDPYPFWHQAEATGGQNYSQWDNRTASEYLEQARVNTDFNIRTRLYRNFQVVFAKELPALPLYYPVYTFAVDERVLGIQVPPLYDISDRYTDITNWYLVTRRSLEPTSESTAEP